MLFLQMFTKVFEFILRLSFLRMFTKVFDLFYACFDHVIFINSFVYSAAISTYMPVAAVAQNCTKGERCTNLVVKKL